VRNVAGDRRVVHAGRGQWESPSPARTCPPTIGSIRPPEHRRFEFGVEEDVVTLRNVKLLKLLSVPAAGLAVMLLAVPVYAHNLTNATITLECEKGQISIDIKGDLTDSPKGRTLEVELFGHTSSGWVDTHQGLTFDLTQNQHEYKGTFGGTDLSKYDQVEVRVVKVSGSDGNDLEIQLAGEKQAHSWRYYTGPKHPLATLKSACVAPSPSPSPSSTPTPTPTPKASPTPTPSGGLGGGTPGLPNTGVQG
jgi:hypothetical protein